MKDKLKFDTYNGIDVYVEPGGTFFAVLDDSGAWVRKDTYEALKRDIERELGAVAKIQTLNLPCLAFVHTETGKYEVIETVLTGLSRADSSLKLKAPCKGLEFVTPATDHNRAILEEYAQARATVERLYGPISQVKIESSRYSGRIPASEYATRLDNLASRFKQAEEKSS